eukprot:1013298-Alexandrium_andersonii.AAC.1
MSQEKWGAKLLLPVTRSGVSHAPQSSCKSLGNAAAGRNDGGVEYNISFVPKSTFSLPKNILPTSCGISR